MALFILFCESGMGKGKMEQREWHVGEVAPFHPGNLRTWDYVEVQADGDELYHITRCSVFIPHVVAANVMTWFGDDARFILANLINKRG